MKLAQKRKNQRERPSKYDLENTLKEMLYEVVEECVKIDKLQSNRKDKVKHAFHASNDHSEKERK